MPHAAGSFTEAGAADYDMSYWWGLAAPAGTPAGMQRRVENETKTWRTLIAKAGVLAHVQRDWPQAEKKGREAGNKCLRRRLLNKDW